MSLLVTAGAGRVAAVVVRNRVGDGLLYRRKGELSTSMGKGGTESC